MTEPDNTVTARHKAPASSDDEARSPARPRPVAAGKYRRSHRDGERWLRTVAVTGGAIILLATVSGQAVRNGDTAAWLSMLFNGVMAAAAVGAYLTARKWVPQLTTQEGYKVAISLVNDEYLFLGPQNPLWISTQPAMSGCRRCLDPVSDTGSDDYSAKIAVLIEAIVREKSRKERIAQAEFRLRTYGLYESPAYADTLAAMKSAFTGSIDAANTLLARLKADLETQKKLEMLDKRSVHFLKDKEHLMEVRRRRHPATEEAYAHLCRKWDDMVALQGTIFNTHPPVGELYAVRK